MIVVNWRSYNNKKIEKNQLGKELEEKYNKKCIEKVIMITQKGRIGLQIGKSSILLKSACIITNFEG